MPHVFVILLVIMILVSVISYLVPSGAFERTLSPEGVTVVNPDNFEFVEQENPITFLDFFRSVYNGFVEGATIMGSLLICSGCLGILNDSGTLTSGIQKLISVSKGKEIISIVIFYSYFAATNIMGAGEGSYPFFPIVTGLVIALGYDRLMGAATIMFGCTAGFACGMVNMFTTGISQQIVGLPMFSGIGYRFLVFVVLYLIGLTAVILYGNKIKKNPDKSYMAAEYKKQLAEAKEASEDEGNTIPFSIQRKIALVGFICMILLQAYGCLNLGWALPELSALYLIFSICVAFLFRFSPNKYCQTFIGGAGQVLGAALVIGLARSVMILLNQAQIMDTLVYYMGNALQGKSPLITLLLIYLFVTALNFFVVSGSGKAVMMMPIMSPLGKMLGINQQVMVLTYQLGDGLTNNLWPGGAAVGCALCGLDYGTWLKFAAKVLGVMIVSGYILIIIANAIGYGPF